MNPTRRTMLRGASALVLSAYAATLAAFASPPPVDLGEAGNFTVLAKTGISSTGATHVVGNIGVSPNSATSISGNFALNADPSNQFSTSILVNGRVYAANYAPPTPAILTSAIGDMMTAYTDAAGRPADASGLGTGGEIGGLTLSPGVYKWGSAVTISNTLVLNGGANDVWIMQVGGTLGLATGIQIQLQGGAQAQNVFWQVAGDTTLGDSSVFNGNILDQTLIAFTTSATQNGKALAQTAVTLQANAVTSSSGGFVGANAPGAAQCIIFPSPAKGGSVTAVYGMANDGTATVLIWNDRGDLVAKVAQDQLAGSQKTVIPVDAFAPGVYLYRVDLSYAGGGEVRSDLKKFTVIK